MSESRCPAHPAQEGEPVSPLFAQRDVILPVMGEEKPVSLPPAGRELSRPQVVWQWAQDWLQTLVAGGVLLLIGVLVLCGYQLAAVITGLTAAALASYTIAEILLGRQKPAPQTDADKAGRS